MGLWSGTVEGMELMQRRHPVNDFWKSKKVLLTGHTGFKGSWLGLWLSELGARVTGIGLEPDPGPSLFRSLQLKDRLQNHQISDIRNYQSLKAVVESCKPEIVIHLAAQPLVRQSYTDPLGTWSTNVQGSLNLLEALKTIVAMRRCDGDH